MNIIEFLNSFAMFMGYYWIGYTLTILVLHLYAREKAKRSPLYYLYLIEKKFGNKS
jgi:hypothetical protein